jgi:hypothetical protein
LAKQAAKTTVQTARSRNWRNKRGESTAGLAAGGGLAASGCGFKGLQDWIDGVMEEWSIGVME